MVGIEQKEHRLVKMHEPSQRASAESRCDEGIETEGLVKVHRRDDA